ncbi:MAG: hypothetical protein ACI867_001550 [Glaciecola sp.]
MKSRQANPRLLAAGFAVLAVLAVAGSTGFVWVDGTPGLLKSPSNVVAALPPAQTLSVLPPQRSWLASESPAAAAVHVAPRGNPTKVVIPGIGVEANLVELGLNSDGSIELPDFGLAGWYEKGPKPGEAGPAVIVAHVDSRSGPDVFYRLRELATGDEIQVVFDSGDTVTFVAVSTEQAPKGELPVDTIWPTTSEELLTLVTCGGEFDRSVGHYQDNVIVYTSLSSTLA